MAALDCGVATLLAAEPLGGLAALRARSLELSTLFIERAATRLAAHALTLATPLDATQRGSQVSLACPMDERLNGHAVMQALIARGVIGDFRAGWSAGEHGPAEPDLLRFGFTPLYTRSVDVYDAVEALGEVLDRGEWREARFQRRSAVT
jgi:kynureninase